MGYKYIEINKISENRYGRKSNMCMGGVEIYSDCRIWSTELGSLNYRVWATLPCGILRQDFFCFSCVHSWAIVSLTPSVANNPVVSSRQDYYSAFLLYIECVQQRAEHIINSHFLQWDLFKHIHWKRMNGFKHMGIQMSRDLSPTGG